MASLQFTTTLLGIGLSALILHLLRRDHLHLAHGLFWILVAAAAAVLGLWPGLIDQLAGLAGISYPPALLLLLAVIVLLIKSLHADMVNTRIERHVRRLNQRVALFELELAEKKSRDDRDAAGDDALARSAERLPERDRRDDHQLQHVGADATVHRIAARERKRA